MRIYFDFEFIETGRAHVMEPISIGIIREDNKTYYAEFAHIPWDIANDWVLKNVKPYLEGGDYVKTSGTISKEIIEFVGEEPEFWAYFASYDWVLLCQLYGRMIDIPKGWPYYCRDIKQYMDYLGINREELNHIPNEQEHNALADAIWNKSVHRYLESGDLSL